MDSINSNPGMGPQIYAMKKAMETQGQGLMKLLDSAQVSVDTKPAPSSGSSLTGLGQTLDIRG
ncbi:hypothetical protein [Sulfuricurvum sp.]|uniref:hypothetical protein n=1 Tax=Sulfuricurvum sp. TaxID=2025608 RepID=UPI003C3568C4